MATKNPLLPTKEQCFALTDEQCRNIQDILDPGGKRFQKCWELQYQPELIRLYMTGMSFPQIESTMTPRLTWSYKTYSNRFRDWNFPLNPAQRDNKIIELYALVSESSTSNPISTQLPIHPKVVPQVRPLQPQPPQQMPSLPPTSAPYGQAPYQAYEPIPQDERNVSGMIEFDRGSVTTIDTISTNSTWAPSVFSHQSRPDSIATTNSSVISLASQRSQYSYEPKAPPVGPLPPLPPVPPVPQRKPLRPPRHDPHNGLWNGILRVIPCGQDHGRLDALDVFERCPVCGFTQWHALMVHARHIKLETFVNTMKSLSNMSDIKRLDYAGNSPIHYLMVAGVGINYFSQLVVRNDDTNQNSFGQNPLHVLNPQDLLDDLVPFLNWFIPRKAPPGLLLTQRDIYGRTPLHALLQHPLPRNLYPKILDVFPFYDHQLRSLDTAGRSTIRMMNDASLKLRSESEADYRRIQDGITFIKQLLAESSQGDLPKYGFNEIARGSKGTSLYRGFYECAICNKINPHTDSYVDQMKCACANGRDRNGPDETGLTPAHAIVVKERSNNNLVHETAEQTAELFRILIPQGDNTLREALHVLDPEGNSLVYNIAVRGFDVLLEYVLSLETPARRLSMVNFCARGPNGTEKSVYSAVLEKVRQVNERLRINRLTENMVIKAQLYEEGARLQKCKHILARAGAVSNPSQKLRWRIIA